MNISNREADVAEGEKWSSTVPLQYHKLERKSTRPDEEEHWSKQILVVGLQLDYPSEEVSNHIIWQPGWDSSISGDLQKEHAAP